MNGNEAMATAEKVTIGDSEIADSTVFDDRSPPPTHAQVEYWRKRCGALARTCRGFTPNFVATSAH